MPTNTTKIVPAKTWTELTAADVTTLTFQASDSVLAVKGTVGSVAPTNHLGAVNYPPFSGERSATLSELWPGLSGVNRVWAFSQSETTVMVSHA